jgi:hypothetical protein
MASEALCFDNRVESSTWSLGRYDSVMTMERLRVAALVLVKMAHQSVERVAVRHDPETDAIEVLLVPPAELARMNLRAVPENAETQTIQRENWEPVKPRE